MKLLYGTVYKILKRRCFRKLSNILPESTNHTHNINISKFDRTIPIRSREFTYFSHLQPRKFVSYAGNTAYERWNPNFNFYNYAGLLGLGCIVSLFYDKKDNSVTIGERLENFFNNCTEKATSLIDKFFPPNNEPLLPDFKELNYPPNLPTLVIDVDKVIAKLVYDRRVGWQVVKRPGADNFFKELVNYYEIVIWSDDNYPMASDVVYKWGLPVIGCIHRDQCKKFKGKFIKDLSRLGRNLNRTILIDHEKTATMMQPENSIIIREFNGSEDDDELKLLIDMLKSIMILI